MFTQQSCYPLNTKWKVFTHLLQEYPKRKLLQYKKPH